MAISAKVYIGDVLVSGGSGGEGPTEFGYPTDKFLRFEPGQTSDTLRVYAADEPALYEGLSTDNLLELVIPYEHGGKYVDIIGSFGPLSQYVNKIKFLAAELTEDDLHQTGMVDVIVFVEADAFYGFNHVDKVYVPDNYVVTSNSFNGCHGIRVFSFDVTFFDFNSVQNFGIIFGSWYWTNVISVQLRNVNRNNFFSVYRWNHQQVNFFSVQGVEKIELTFNENVGMGPDDRLVIPPYFFSQATSLREVVFPEGGLPIQLEEGAFHGCHQLQIRSLSNVAQIGREAFYGTAMFESLVIDNTAGHLFHGQPITLRLLDGVFAHTPVRSLTVITDDEVYLQDGAFSQAHNFSVLSVFDAYGNLGRIRCEGYYIFDSSGPLMINAFFTNLMYDSLFGGSQLREVRIYENIENIYDGVFDVANVIIVYCDAPWVIQSASDEGSVGGLFKGAKLLFLPENYSAEAGQYILDNFYPVDNVTVPTEKGWMYQVWLRNSD